MKRVNFNSVGGEAVACLGSSEMTKKQRVSSIENRISDSKKRLKLYKKDMKALALLGGRYSYNSEYLNLMIGQCFIEINQAKVNIKEHQKMMNKIKEEK